MNKNSSVLIIYTGGTIGMVENPATGSLEPFDFDLIVEQVPELKRFQFNVDSIALDQIKDSSNIIPADWVELASIIEENYLDYDGFVVLHGTDTMAYSASALSFMLENLAKPVIFTGSQLPIGALRTDGKENLITSLEIAASKLNGKPIIPEVCVYFENELYRGNRTSKYSAEHFDAFHSPNLKPLAIAGIHIDYNTNLVHSLANDKLFKVYKKIDKKVASLKMFPGLSNEVISLLIKQGELDGLILETYGAGNVSFDTDLIKMLTQAINKGMVVVNISQCSAGRVEMGRYETSNQLLAAGVISGYDMTFEAALTKLMFLLANCDNSQEVKEKYIRSICGEMSVELS